MVTVVWSLGRARNLKDYDQVLTHSLNDYVSNYDYVNSLGNYDFLSSENFNACIDNDDDMCFLNYR